MIIIDDFEVPYIPRTTSAKDEYPIEEVTENDTFISSVQLIAGLRYPLEDIWGYEIWEKKNSSTGLHLDKDEKLYERRDVLSYPICSIVYYYQVSDLVGGELIAPNNWSVTPKQSRLVVFGPGIPHKVSEFTGIRNAVLVNFWQERLGTIPKNSP